jgi:sulfate/thiosulfate transport system substrate-binding protein
MGFRVFTSGLLVAAAATVLVACGGSSDTSGGSTTASTGGKTTTKLALVAYSTPQDAYGAIIPAFQNTPAGKGIGFTQSYGPSGDQSRAVDAGQPADVVAFSLAPDITRLVDDKLVSPSWDSGQYKGIVTDSVAAIVVRKGNPKHIKTWADLVKPGVQVLTPNPFTSGSARWNIMAVYGAQLKEGKTPAQALAFLKTLLTKHVPVQDSSARNALNTFLAGKGDALISYENEAIEAQQKGKDVDYVIPSDTILIENPVAAISTGKHVKQAQSFVDFLTTPAAQKAFASKGYRPVVPSVLKQFHFPTPSGLFTIASLGGWPKVMDTFFDPDHGSVAKIEQSAGVSTDK